MSTTRINDSDLASVALYDKVNQMVEELDAEVVKLTGDQTINDTKTFKKAPVLQNEEFDSRIVTKNSFNLGDLITSNVFNGFKGVDANGEEFANCNCSYSTAGRVGCNFYVSRGDSGSTVSGSLGVYIDEGGTSAYTQAPTPPTSDNSTKIATTAWVNTKVASALPAGTIIPYAANSAPSGFVLCNGAAVSRTTYSALFAKIGTTYGAGDGSTTFNLPNLTDKFIQGSGTAGTTKAAGLPNITGELGGQFNATQYDKYVTGVFRIDGKSNQAQGGGGSKTSNAVSFNASRSSSIYGKSSTVQPPALTMRYYIKY